MRSAFSDQTELVASSFEDTHNHPLETEFDLLAAAAEEIHALALSLNGAGCSVAALHLHSGASALDQVLPARQGWWSAPFNGQKGRSELFLRVLNEVRPAAIIETGTFRGTTTAYMGENFDGPILTCELDPRWYLFSRANLAGFPNIEIRRQDSRDFLKEVLAKVKGDTLLYYLDAHWQEDLPLIGELELILSNERAGVIIIDDFAVPFDPVYEFDDYGPGKALTLELLSQADSNGASLFFPALPAREETGARRGCAVIAIGVAASQLCDLAELRPYDWPPRAAVPAKSRASSPPNLEPLRRLVTSRNVELERAATRVEADGLRQERDASRAEADALRQQRDVSRAEADVLRQERDTSRAEADVLRQERDTSRAQADALRQQRDVSRAEADVLRQERDTSRAESAALHSEAVALRASTSWRITAPLRALINFFRRR
ncbi:hypothetical protein [Bradyrhizobium genosp. P]|uniref:hypothetical protein n=1 Tax=Bradyrhizobium genosp. P TaxID=83641 RepID=UPI003CF0458C